MASCEPISSLLLAVRKEYDAAYSRKNTKKWHHVGPVCSRGGYPWTNIYPVDSEVCFVNNCPFLFSSFFPFNPIELTASHRIDCKSLLLVTNICLYEMKKRNVCSELTFCFTTKILNLDQVVCHAHPVDTNV